MTLVIFCLSPLKKKCSFETREAYVYIVFICFSPVSYTNFVSICWNFMNRVTEFQNVHLFDIIRLYLSSVIVRTMLLSSTYSSIGRPE